MADTPVTDDASSANDKKTAAQLQVYAQMADPSLPKGSGMFAPSTESFASSAKVYMENRRDELVHEIDAVHEVSALFQGMSSQVDELIKCLAIQVNAIAEEAQNAAHKALRGQGVKILKLAYLDQLEQANVYMKAHIQDCSSAAGMVMTGANRKYKSQAAEMVKLRNELRKALLGDNPGWEVERMKMKREARDLNRAMKKLQNENDQMRKELDALGVVREAEKSEISVSMDAEIAKLENTTVKMWKHRRMSQTWVQWLTYVNEGRLRKKDEKAAAAQQRQEQQQQQLKQQLEKLQSEHRTLQIEAAAASASKGRTPIAIPSPPAPVIIEAPPPPKHETVDASTQASQPLAVIAPPKAEEDEGTPVRDVHQTHEYKEAMAMQASRRKAHQENMILRKHAGRIARNKAAFFREWRRTVEDNKRTNLILLRSIKRFDNARTSEAFYHWLKLTEELKGWVDGQYERHLVRRSFERFREKTLKREVDDAIKNLKGYIEQPLMKVVAVACHERELRGDLEVLLEESLALLVRCMKGGVDADEGLQGRLRTQIGRLLDARWIIRKRTTGKGAALDASSNTVGALPAKPWEEWDEAPRAGAESRHTTDSDRHAAYQDFDELRQKHSGLPVSLRRDAGEIPKDEMLPQPDSSDPPATMAQLPGGSGMSIMIGDWEMERWEEGWGPFKELTDAIGMVLSSIGKCPPVEFWRGFWSSWARFVSDEASGAGEVMDTLENGPEPSYAALPAAPPEPAAAAAAAAAEPPAPVAPPVDGLPSSMAAFLNQQPGRPTTGQGRKGRGSNPGPPVLYASSKRPSRTSAAPVRPPTSGPPFGTEVEPRSTSGSSGSGVGIRFSVRIPTGPEPPGGKSRNQSPTPDLQLTDGEIAGWGKEGAPAGLPRRTTPSPDPAGPAGRHDSKRQSAASDLDSDPSNIKLNMPPNSKGGLAWSASDCGNLNQDDSYERTDALDKYVELINQEPVKGDSGDHAMHQQHPSTAAMHQQRPSTAAVHGRQKGAVHIDDAQPSLRQGQVRPLQPTPQRGGGSLNVHVVRPSTAHPRLAPGATQQQGAAPAPFSERKQRPSSAMGTHPKREAVTKAGHPPKRPSSAMVNQNSSQVPSQKGPGNQKLSAARKTDPALIRPQQERPAGRKGGHGQGQEPEATPARKASLAEVIPERAGAAETAKSCRPSFSARKRHGSLMMTLE